MTKDGSTLRVLALMEATTVSGPAKNLIEFCRRARTLDPLPSGAPAFEISIVTFHRGAPDPPAARAPNNGGEPARGAAGVEAPNLFVAAAREAGVTVDVIPERFRFDPRVVGELKSIVARRAPHVIQSHQIKSHFLVKLAGLWRERPWIAFHHGYTETDLKMQLYNRLNRWSLPACDRVVTVCEAFARQLAAREGVRPERIAVRHNSIKAGGFTSAGGDEARALRERHGIKDGERVVLAIGRLSREKGHVDLINALGQLRRARPDIDFKLLVVGEGPERPRVERAAADEGITERVVFFGQVGDVRPYYAAADVLALPSHSEGSPNVLLETMAAGVPAVAASVGGVPEIATHEQTALLVAPRDPAAMAEALARVLSDARLAEELAANAAALVSAAYSPEAYARSLFGIYRELAGGRRQTPRPAA